MGWEMSQSLMPCTHDSWAISHFNIKRKMQPITKGAKHTCYKLFIRRQKKHIGREKKIVSNEMPKPREKIRVWWITKYPVACNVMFMFTINIKLTFRIPFFSHLFPDTKGKFKTFCHVKRRRGIPWIQVCCQLDTRWHMKIPTFTWDTTGL